MGRGLSSQPRHCGCGPVLPLHNGPLDWTVVVGASKRHCLSCLGAGVSFLAAECVAAHAPRATVTHTKVLTCRPPPTPTPRLAALAMPWTGRVLSHFPACAYPTPSACNAASSILTSPRKQRPLPRVCQAGLCGVPGGTGGHGRIIPSAGEEERCSCDLVLLHDTDTGS